MSDAPFVGEIVPFGGNFAPRGYATCDGQLLSISQNEALFALIGTTYGGDGQSTFALPDLRGRHGIHVGQGPGLSQYDIGQSGGVETVSLSTISVPPHNHQILASTIGGTSKDPTAHYFATNNAKPYGKLPAQAHSTATPTPMAAGILVSSPAQPHDNMAPFQALTFIIALFGIFPSRN